MLHFVQTLTQKHVTTEVPGDVLRCDSLLQGKSIWYDKQYIFTLHWAVQQVSLSEPYSGKICCMASRLNLFLNFSPSLL